MSFILDALKKSQPKAEESVPSAITQQHMYAAPETTSEFNWWPLVIVLLIALSASVGFLLAKVTSTHEVVSVNDTVQQPAYVQPTQPHVVALPQPIPQANNQQAVQPQPPVNTAKPASSSSNNLAMKFSQPEQANEVVRPVKVVKPKPKPEPVGKPVLSVADQQAQEEVEISDDLLKKFNSALQAVGEFEDSSLVTEQTDAYDEYSNIPLAAEMPVRVQRAIPAMSFSQHMYASESRERWVKVNDIQLYEGQWLDDNVQLVSVQPRFVVMAINQSQFRLPALTDW